MHRVSLQEKELTCPICIDIFDEPKSLPKCAHNVCEKCLHGIAVINSRNEFVTCPVCRVVSYLTPGGVSRLPSNHFMKTVIEGLPGRKEVQAIKKAVEACEKDLSSSKAHVDDCDRFITALKSAQLNAQRVKKQISDHAEYLIDLIQNERASLTAEVDQRNEIISSLLSNLRKERKTTSFTVKESEKILAETNGIIERGNVQEIIEKKDESLSKLKEKTAVLSRNSIFTFPDVPENIHFIKSSECCTGRDTLGYLRRDSVMVEEEYGEYCESEYEDWVPVPSISMPSPSHIFRRQPVFGTLPPHPRGSHALFVTTASDYMPLIQRRPGYRHPVFKPLPKPPLPPRPPSRRQLRQPTSIAHW